MTNQVVNIIKILEKFIYFLQNIRVYKKFTIFTHSNIKHTMMLNGSTLSEVCTSDIHNIRGINNELMKEILYNLDTYMAIIMNIMHTTDINVITSVKQLATKLQSLEKAQLELLSVYAKHKVLYGVQFDTIMQRVKRCHFYSKNQTECEKRCIKPIIDGFMDVMYTAINKQRILYIDDLFEVDHYNDIRRSMIENIVSLPPLCHPYMIAFNDINIIRKYYGKSLFEQNVPRYTYCPDKNHTTYVQTDTVLPTSVLNFIEKYTTPEVYEYFEKLPKNTWINMYHYGDLEEFIYFIQDLWNIRHRDYIHNYIFDNDMNDPCQLIPENHDNDDTDDDNCIAPIDYYNNSDNSYSSFPGAYNSKNQILGIIVPPSYSSNFYDGSHDVDDDSTDIMKTVSNAVSNVSSIDNNNKKTDYQLMRCDKNHLLSKIEDVRMYMYLFSPFERKLLSMYDDCRRYIERRKLERKYIDLYRRFSYKDITSDISTISTDTLITEVNRYLDTVDLTYKEAVESIFSKISPNFKISPGMYTISFFLEPKVKK